MISIDEMETILEEISEQLPQDFYKDLNGGVLLLPEAKLHDKSMGDDLYVMGEYHRDSSLGRYIAIYYGSFEKIYGFASREQMKQQLMKTLKHEFRHHLESMAGDKSLEQIDAQDIGQYLQRKTGQSI